MLCWRRRAGFESVSRFLCCPGTVADWKFLLQSIDDSSTSHLLTRQNYRGHLMPPSLEVHIRVVRQGGPMELVWHSLPHRRRQSEAVHAAESWAVQGSHSRLSRSVRSYLRTCPFTV